MVRRATRRIPGRRGTFERIVRPTQPNAPAGPPRTSDSVTHEMPPTPAIDREPAHSAAAGAPPGDRRGSADLAARRPAYRGEELDAARGPGLGCFWFQAAVLAVFLVLIPIGVELNWPFEVLAGLLFVVLGLLLFVGQTLIFLLRLVAADRRDAGRRRPRASSTPTVGELEDGLLGAPGADEAAEVAGTAPDAAETAPDAAGTAPNAVGAAGAIAATDLPVPPTVEPESEGVRE